MAQDSTNDIHIPPQKGGVEAVITQEKLGSKLKDYILMLAERYPFTKVIRLDPPRIRAQLAEFWPDIPEWNTEAMLIWNQIEDIAHSVPLAYPSLNMVMRISVAKTEMTPHMIPEPHASAVIAAFDGESGIMRSCTLPPSEQLPALHDLVVKTGLLVVCQPLHPLSNQFSDMLPDAFAMPTVVDDIFGERARDRLLGGYVKDERYISRVGVGFNQPNLYPEDQFEAQLETRRKANVTEGEYRRWRNEALEAALLFGAEERTRGAYDALREQPGTLPAGENLPDAENERRRGSLSNDERERRQNEHERRSEEHERRGPMRDAPETIQGEGVEGTQLSEGDRIGELASLTAATEAELTSPPGTTAGFPLAPVRPEGAIPENVNFEGSAAANAVPEGGAEPQRRAGASTAQAGEARAAGTTEAVATAALEAGNTADNNQAGREASPTATSLEEKRGQATSEPTPEATRAGTAPAAEGSTERGVTSTAPKETTAISGNAREENLAERDIEEFGVADVKESGFHADDQGNQSTPNEALHSEETHPVERPSEPKEYTLPDDGPFTSVLKDYEAEKAFGNDSETKEFAESMAGHEVERGESLKESPSLDRRTISKDQDVHASYQEVSTPRAIERNSPFSETRAAAVPEVRGAHLEHPVDLTSQSQPQASLDRQLNEVRDATPVAAQRGHAGNSRIDHTVEQPRNVGSTRNLVPENHSAEPRFALPRDTKQPEIRQTQPEPRVAQLTSPSAQDQISSKAPQVRGSNAHQEETPSPGKSYVLDRPKDLSPTTFHETITHPLEGLHSSTQSSLVSQPHVLTESHLPTTNASLRDQISTSFTQNAGNSVRRSDVVAANVLNEALVNTAAARGMRFNTALTNDQIRANLHDLHEQRLERKDLRDEHTHDKVRHEREATHAEKVLLKEKLEKAKATNAAHVIAADNIVENKPHAPHLGIEKLTLDE